MVDLQSLAVDSWTSITLVALLNDWTWMADMIHDALAWWILHARRRRRTPRLPPQTATWTIHRPRRALWRLPQPECRERDCSYYGRWKCYEYYYCEQRYRDCTGLGRERHERHRHQGRHPGVQQRGRDYQVLLGPRRFQELLRDPASPCEQRRVLAQLDMHALHVGHHPLPLSLPHLGSLQLLPGSSPLALRMPTQCPPRVVPSLRHHRHRCRSSLSLSRTSLVAVRRQRRMKAPLS
ncbi:hypothetical protein EXIGLDRAFT_199233 [Exidia glandulosa HHB12029]|uniref:Uncharacterized protein n=1 Tax=Exidia glandulosa HHB12029 TaxID=1314781 RepID=A0A165MY58_EXIGL|nr:hypothetical protein EXIGLDRAFT_199233 [Exidia glandulosa HHB12029]